MGTKTRRTINHMLRKSGLSYSIKSGGKHYKVFIENELICVLSRTDSPTSGSLQGDDDLFKKISKAIIRKRAGE